jgi:hypothetical protein
MANSNNFNNRDAFFDLLGATELSKELKALSEVKSINSIIKPAMHAGAAEIRKIARKDAPKQKGSGVLKKSIKNKTFIAKRGAKGVISRIGVFVKGTAEVPNGKKTVHPATYGSAINYGTTKAGKNKNVTIEARNFLGKALQKGDAIGVEKVIAKTQVQLDKWHQKQAKKNASKK